jgi:F0F1-type ATP synthase gamma subunit
MSNKLSEVQARMNGVHGLESVVGAMRGIAAARSREARSRLDGIRACARIVSAAIGDALLLIDDHASHEIANTDAKQDAAMVIVLCAEQGFVGTFNEHVIDAALASSLGAARASSTEYLLLGDRGIVAATERGLNVGWSAPMVTHADEVPALADRLTGVLFQRLVAGRTTRVSVVHATPNPTASVQTVEQTLLPFDYGRFSAASSCNRSPQSAAHYAPTAAPVIAACGGIHLRAALRGHHAVVRCRKRSAHAGDDRCTHERARQARSIDRRLSPAEARGDHVGDRGAFSRKHRRRQTFKKIAP